MITLFVNVNTTKIIITIFVNVNTTQLIITLFVLIFLLDKNLKYVYYFEKPFQ